MNSKRREFLKTVGTGAFTFGLGGSSFFSCSSGSAMPDTEPDQLLEISENGAIVETRFGKVRGYRRRGIYTYKGIPYGGTTSGGNRFMAPVPPEPWTGKRNALYWGPSAPQNSGRYGNANNFREKDMDAFCGAFTYHWSDKYYGEDCLRINVWTPNINDNGNRPVLVWFHGGGFAHGSSVNLDAYIGENLSRSGNVVVCTINHRLNAFGYINLGAVCGEDFPDAANAGMLDIVASLQWIRENIDRFGGNPGNVTIFGQSGGGAKVSTVMAMPSAKGLFHKAMTISGAALRVAEYDGTAELADAVLLEAGLKASEARKLQNLPWMEYFDLAMKARESISGTSGGMSGGFSPCVDKLHIPQHPFEPSAPVISSGIPMIIGNCTSEMSPTVSDPTVFDVTLDELKEKLRESPGFSGGPMGRHASDIVNAYAKCFPGKMPVEIWGMVAWDMRTNAVRQAERQTANDASVYNYWFNWKTPLYDSKPGAYHNTDIAFWFNNTDIMDTITGGGARPRRLADKMSQALIHFARKGDPNHPGIPEWPKYDRERGAVMIWDDECEVRNDPDRPARNLMNSIKTGN